MPEERLQRFLARAGLASRRAAEGWIRGGRVTVNGRVTTELGTRVDPDRDEVRVNGRRLRPQPPVYLMLHKPAGYVTTARDPEGRPTVLDLVGGLPIRVFPVGRLDADTTGLLLLTNDGELAHALTHPSRGVEKRYRVRLQGRVAPPLLDRLRRGVPLADGMTAPARVRLLRAGPHATWLELGLHEGRNRQVRRMGEAIGHPVTALCRVAVGPLTLGELPAGAWRHLTPQEVASLQAAAAAPAERGRRRGRSRRRQEAGAGAGAGRAGGGPRRGRS